MTNEERLEAANTQLIRDLREMDQLVYQMSQSGSAEQLRSAVQRAWAITEARMRRESNRIAEVLIPELKKVYNDEALSKAAPSEARLARPEHAGDSGLSLSGRISGRERDPGVRDSIPPALAAPKPKS